MNADQALDTAKILLDSNPPLLHRICRDFLQQYKIVENIKKNQMSRIQQEYFRYTNHKQQYDKIKELLGKLKKRDEKSGKGQWANCADPLFSHIYEVDKHLEALVPEFKNILQTINAEEMETDVYSLLVDSVAVDYVQKRREFKHYLSQKIFITTLGYYKLETLKREGNR